MEVSKFVEKLNKVDENIYTVEEKVIPENGLYEGILEHDNINEDTLAVYSGPKLTGEQIQTYSLSTPSMAPWKRGIKIYTSYPAVYISYETDGDTVEADDVNLLQSELVRTQEALNEEEARAKKAEQANADAILEESERAKEAEEANAKAIEAESKRAQEAETSNANAIEEESRRAQEAETRLTDGLQAEIDRAKAAEQKNAEDISAESQRAAEAEAANAAAISEEASRAKAAEQANANAIATETTRAKAAETANADAITAEATRAKAAEKANTDAIAAEKTRAEAAEEALQGNIDAHTEAVAGEIQALKAKDTELDQKKADAAEVSKELANRYTKDQVFTKEEVLQKIEDLIATAPETLDTFKEIADALGNDPNFAATMMNMLAGKVDKVDGKQLSTNDYTDTEKATLADVNSKKHTHSNKSIIDKITQGLLDNWNAAYTHISDSVKHITSGERTNWNSAYSHISEKDNPHGVTKSQVGLGNVPNVATNNQTPTFTQAEERANIVSGEKLSVMLGKIAKAIADLSSHLSDTTKHITSGERTNWNDANSKKHTHSNKSVLDTITEAMLDKLNGISEGANKYVHPTSAGYKHIPSGGASGQILRWKANGEAQWGSDNNTTYSAATQSANGLMSAADKKKLDGIAEGANKYTHPTSSGNKHIPAGGQSGQILRWSADGTAAWGNDNNTTYSAFKGASSSAAGGSGLVPAPAAGAQAKYLRGDGTWQTPPNTTYGNMGGASSTAAGKAGLVPAPAAGAQAKYLRGDGTWQTPPDTKYTHPTSAGNKHIPAGGSSGQVLKWKADGEAQWGSDNNTDTKATQTNTTANADYRVLFSYNSSDTTETQGTRKSGNFLMNPTKGEFFAKGFRRNDLTGKTLDINTLNLSAGYPQIMRYIEKTSGGAANITNIPVAGQPFLLDVEIIRWASTTDYITMQTFRSSSQKTYEYVRYCTSGTWSGWTTRKFTDTTYGAFKGATSSAAGGTGLVPAPAAGKQAQYLRGDGTWQTPTDTKYTHPSSGVTAGTYISVTVNAQGHVTNGTNPTTLSGYGITDAAAKNHNHDTVYVKKGVISVSLSASGWTGSAAPYSQKVSNSSLKAANDYELVSMLADGAAASTQEAYNKAFAIISQGTAVSADGSVTFKVYKKPATTITVGLKGA